MAETYASQETSKAGGNLLGANLAQELSPGSIVLLGDSSYQEKWSRPRPDRVEDL